MDIPTNGQTFLHAVVSNYYTNADWELVCRVNGVVQKTVMINEGLTKGGWATVTFDLTPFAGKNILIELENKANDWHREYGFWASLTIDSSPPFPGRHLVEFDERGVPIHLFDLRHQPADVREVDLTWAKWDSARTDRDTPMRGRTPVFEWLNQDGVLRVGGRRFESGLFTHAESLYQFDLGGNWQTFRSGYGIQDGMVAHGASVAFVVRGDGKELFRSPVIRDNRLRRLEVDVTGVNILELIVEDGGDGVHADWGVWIEPTLERRTLPTPPVSPPASSTPVQSRELALRPRSTCTSQC
jgi:hypothetical protein